MWHAYTIRAGIRSKSKTERLHAGTVSDSCRSRNAAGPEEGHKFNNRSIKDDYKNLLHFDHHEIIVSWAQAPTHTPMQWGRLQCWRRKVSPERPRQEKGQWKMTERWLSRGAAEFGRKLDSQAGWQAGRVSILQGCQRRRSSFVTFNRFVILSS